MLSPALLTQRLGQGRVNVLALVRPCFLVIKVTYNTLKRRILVVGADTEHFFFTKGEFMNICVVSTFDGTTDDFMEIVNWAKDKLGASVSLPSCWR